MKKLENKTSENTQFIPLTTVVAAFDSLFMTNELSKDPAMGKFLPRTYDALGFNWKDFFEPDFCNRFNGVMIKGAATVSSIYCASFPTPDVLAKFLGKSNEGDLLFLHHPINMECGAPNGNKGKGFMAIDPQALQLIKDKKLSIYTCHAPLDCSASIGTNAAIVEALGATVIKEYLPYANGNAGRIVSISTIPFTDFLEKVKRIFGVNRLDIAGKHGALVSKIAIVAGGGDSVADMQSAESEGCDVYLTGEIHSNHSGDWGSSNTKAIDDYASITKMALIGVSHSASEYLVMALQLVPWIKENLKINAEPIPQNEWWK